MNKLTEIFDNPEPYSEFKKDGDFIYSLFSVNEKDYFVGFYYSSPQYFNSIKNMYHIDFNNPRIRNNYAFAFGLLDSSFNKDFDSPVEFLKTQKVDDTTTNTGDVFKVFSTVGHIFVDFLRKYNPDGIYYAAKESNRYNIYRFLTKKLITLFSKYTAYEQDHFFIVYRKELKESKLTELFDTFSDYKTNYEGYYTFSLPNVEGEYDVFLDKKSNEEIKEYLSEECYIDLQTKRDISGFEVSFTLNDSYMKSNTGYAATVFSTVGKIIKDYLQKVDPDFFYFESTNAEESRMRLYELFSKKILREAPEYTFDQLNAPVVEKDIYFFYKPNIIELKDNY